MSSNLMLANIFRIIARIGSVLVLLVGIPFLLFIGLQLFDGTANLEIYLFLFLLAAMCAGLIIAWKYEGLGALITSISMVGYFILSGGLLPGVGSGQDLALFAGPINLCFALSMPGYHPEVSPSARLVPWISWGLQTIPVVLFFASWLLRKTAKSQVPQEVSTASKKKKGK